MKTAKLIISLLLRIPIYQALWAFAGRIFSSTGLLSWNHSLPDKNWLPPVGQKYAVQCGAPNAAMESKRHGLIDKN